MPSKAAGNQKAKITWNRELKLCLHVLHTEFDLTLQQRANIFNHVFQRYLSACGLTEGTTGRTLSVQYNERKKPTARDWPSICQAPTSSADREAYDSIKARIQDALPTLKPANARNKTGRTSNVQATRAQPRRTVTTDSAPSTFRTTIAGAAYSPPTMPARATRASAMVLIPSSPITSSKVTSLSPPSKAPRKRLDLSPLIVRSKNDGSTYKVREDVVVADHVEPVSQLRAHPPLPALLFRFWHEVPGCKRNSETGFWARKYYRCNVLPDPRHPPKSIHLDTTDVYKHMDRKDVDTPFVSTCSRLVWIVQLLLIGLEDGEESGRLSIIDTSKLDRRTIFYARPFHDEICKTYGFTYGAFRYSGTYEYLIWRDIPARAMVHTFKAKDLLSFVRQHLSIDSALRFDILQRTRLSSANKRKEMKKNKMSLSKDLAIGMSQLCAFFGLNVHSLADHLSHMVMDIIEGWVIQVERREPQDWYSLATVFERHLSKQSTKPITEMERIRVRGAFLDGVHWGCGEVNSRHSAKRIAKKDRQAARVGLANPAKIVADVLAAQSFELRSHQAMEVQRLTNYHERRQLMIEGGQHATENVSDDDEDEIPWDVENVMPEEEEQIRYDYDGDDQDELAR